MSGKWQALTSRLRGQAGELSARKHLESEGLKHLHSNYRSRFGEIDLIMQDGQTVVFVEVRVRSSAQFGGALASVDYKKQQKLLKTGLAYLQAHAPNAFSRFDVIAICEEELEWIKGAFDAS